MESLLKGRRGSERARRAKRRAGVKAGGHKGTGPFRKFKLLQLTWREEHIQEKTGETAEVCKFRTVCPRLRSRDFISIGLGHHHLGVSTHPHAGWNRPACSDLHWGKLRLAVGEETGLRKGTHRSQEPFVSSCRHPEV